MLIGPELWGVWDNCFPAPQGAAGRTGDQAQNITRKKCPEPRSLGREGTGAETSTTTQGWGHWVESWPQRLESGPALLCDTRNPLPSLSPGLPIRGANNLAGNHTSHAGVVKNINLYSNVRHILGFPGWKWSQPQGRLRDFPSLFLPPNITF